MFTIGVFGIITDDKDRVLLCHRRDFDGICRVAALRQGRVRGMLW